MKTTTSKHAFRPQADRLETREVLSTYTGTTVFPVVNFNPTMTGGLTASTLASPYANGNSFTNNSTSALFPTSVLGGTGFSFTPVFNGTTLGTQTNLNGYSNLTNLENAGLTGTSGLFGSGLTGTSSLLGSSLTGSNALANAYASQLSALTSAFSGLSNLNSLLSPNLTGLASLNAGTNLFSTPTTTTTTASPYVAIGVKNPFIKIPNNVNPLLYTNLSSNTGTTAVNPIGINAGNTFGITSGLTFNNGLGGYGSGASYLSNTGLLFNNGTGGFATSTGASSGLNFTPYNSNINSLSGNNLFTGATATGGLFGSL